MDLIQKAVYNAQPIETHEEQVAKTDKRIS